MRADGLVEKWVVLRGERGFDVDGSGIYLVRFDGFVTWELGWKVWRRRRDRHDDVVEVWKKAPMAGRSGVLKPYEREFRVSAVWAQEYLVRGRNKDGDVTHSDARGSWTLTCSYIYAYIQSGLCIAARFVTACVVSLLKMPVYSLGTASSVFLRF